MPRMSRVDEVVAYPPRVSRRGAAMKSDARLAEELRVMAGTSPARAVLLEAAVRLETADTPTRGRRRVHQEQAHHVMAFARQVVQAGANPWKLYKVWRQWRASLRHSNLDPT